MERPFELPSSQGPYTIAPSKIIALGLNYRDHIQESVSVNVRGFDPVEPTEPVIFPKSPSALIPSGAAIRLPAILGDYQFPDERTDYEGELAVIIGRQGFAIPQARALDYVLGYTCANDVSQRNVQNGDRTGWFRGKSFDTFLPLGPRIVLRDELKDPQNLQITTRLNGKMVQTGFTGQMIFAIPEMIAWISRNFTLFPGDIILTGTPAGVGPIAHGDTVEVEIQQIGILENPVVDSRNDGSAV